MTFRPLISASISRVAISLLLLTACCMEAGAQRFLKLEKDTIPLFRGFAVSFPYLTSSFTFSSAQASLALRSLNHDLFAVDDIDALSDIG